ncbi:PTS lactose/cellobiose transporter subunit IIA [Amphibacillus jilinensis]|uniref:PTS lactose/cellobiose transporter subunit IIA n=1 Tax=Amphibacillus jilinensis TaxID=1216008 RepID=UPI0002EBAF2D|nr:PTS lactose/cellobiose transporter subunit IIA [Amphibacillus jilinensis]
MDFQEIIIGLIVNAGNAKSKAMEAIKCAKTGHFNKAETFLIEAEQQMSEAHKVQTSLIQGEARGESYQVSLLMVHAQDHLMTSLTIQDLAREFVDLYKKTDTRKVEC